MALLDIINNNTRAVVYSDRPDVTSVLEIVSASSTNSTDIKGKTGGKQGGRITIS